MSETVAAGRATFAGTGACARAQGLAAWWVRDDESLEMTPAARERTAWVRGEA